MYEIDGKCRKCKNYGMAICGRCDMFYSEFDPIDEPKQTNADRIRAMTDEELAEWLAKNDPECDPPEWWLGWLKQEAEEGE